MFELSAAPDRASFLPPALDASLDTQLDELICELHNFFSRHISLR